MAFWNRKKRQEAKAKKEELKRQVKAQEAFSAVEERADANILLWVKQGLDRAFNELGHRLLVLQAIKNLDREGLMPGITRAIEAEMRRIQGVQVAEPSVNDEAEERDRDSEEPKVDIAPEAAA